MTDVLARYRTGKLWSFDGGIHPPEMKSQSNSSPISTALLTEHYYIPVKQHSGSAGNLLVKVGDYVLKGQPLTQGDGLRTLPVHAPTSGQVIDISPYIAAHPSGLSELAIHIHADGKDQWREQYPINDYKMQSATQLIERIYQAGVAGLGGAVFPTAAKIHSAQQKIKLLIINGAECEPYITCDDRLMREYAEEIIEGCRILNHILQPEKTVIAVEDNKPEAIRALKTALRDEKEIDIRAIPTKYPSGDSAQLTYILTGMEIPSGQRSSSIGVLMQNVGTVFAIKRAIINDEPLIERVVTLTGEKIPQKGNQWVRFGTPISVVLKQAGYQWDEDFPVYLGGPMMGLALPDLDAPVTKTANCLLAPDATEYAPPPVEQACIRCSACSDACPLHLMPQQLYWFARAEEQDKSKEYRLMDCIECGICAYVCPSNIPLIQYFRQEKAKIWEAEEKAKKAEEAKIRFEARQARLEKEEQARKARTEKAAAARREEIANNQGIDPVQAALERLKAKKANQETTMQSDYQENKTIVSEKGEVLPDNSDLMAQRKARRLARQQIENNSQPYHIQSKTNEHSTTLEEAQIPQTDKKAAVAAALARAKAKKLAQQAESTAESQPENPAQNTTQSAVENPIVSENQIVAEIDPKKAAVAAAIARAKAKKLAQQAESTAESQQENPAQNTTQSAVENPTVSEAQIVAEIDPKKAAVAAAIARAKAKKLAQQAESTAESQQENPAENTAQSAVENPIVSEAQSVAEIDPKKAAVAAAIARAKAKKLAQQAESTAESQQENPAQNAAQSAVENPTVSEAQSVAEIDPKKAAVAAAIARAKAKKLAQQAESTAESQQENPAENPAQSAVENPIVSEAQIVAEIDPKKAAVAAAIARAKAKKLAQQEKKGE
ncbi:MAG: electron transport complex subunit RsxC [Lonepinella koalarum]|nr:electron transport complex subunit RsxC [Lonepinella koalarum]